MPPKANKIRSFLALCSSLLFFTQSAFALDVCSILSKKIKFSQATIKNNQDYLNDLKEIANDRNNFVNGKMMTSVRWGIKTSFLLSPAEAKENVEKFFLTRLTVDENLQISVPMVFAQNVTSSLDELDRALTTIDEENKKIGESIEKSASDLRQKKHNAIAHEVNEILNEAKAGSSKGNIEKFGVVANDISDTEVLMAATKTQLRREQLYLKNLVYIQNSTKMLCQ